MIIQKKIVPTGSFPMPVPRICLTLQENCEATPVPEFSPFLIWFLIGVGFLNAELQAPGFILIFFTAGCWITAVATWLVPTTTTGQIILFIVSSVVLLALLRKFSLKTFKGETFSDVDAKIGKTAVVTRAIAPHAPGEIKAMGSFWRAEADEAIAEGASVMIEEKASEDGLTYKVKPV